VYTGANTQLLVHGVQTPSFLGAPTEHSLHNTMYLRGEQQKPGESTMSAASDTCQKCFVMDSSGNQFIMILCLPCYVLNAVTQCVS
jgi:hypothetical protein